MAYNPAEGNNPYSDDELEKEYTTWQRVGMKKSPEEVAEIKRDFLMLLAKGATVTKALAVINGSDAWFGAETTKVGRKTIYSWRKYDEQFRQDWDEAYAIGNDKYETRLAEYALEEDPRLIDKVLKFRNPRRYATQRVEASGPDGGPIPVDVIEIVAADDGDNSTEEQGSD